MNYTPTQRIFPRKEFEPVKKPLKKRTSVLLEISSPSSSNNGISKDFKKGATVKEYRRLKTFGLGQMFRPLVILWCELQVFLIGLPNI